MYVMGCCQSVQLWVGDGVFGLYREGVGTVLEHTRMLGIMYIVHCFVSVTLCPWPLNFLEIISLLHHQMYFHTDMFWFTPF